MSKPSKTNFLLLELIRRSNRIFRSNSVINDKKELALKSKEDAYNTKIRGLYDQIKIKDQKLKDCKTYITSDKLERYIKDQKLEADKKLSEIKNKITDCQKEYAQIKKEIRKNKDNKNAEQKTLKELKNKISICEKENSKLKEKIKDLTKKADANKKQIKDKNKKSLGKEAELNSNPSEDNEISQLLEKLYNVSSQIAKSKLELNDLTEAKNIFKVLMAKEKDRALKSMKGGDVFANNIAANLIKFGKHAHSTITRNNEKIAEMTIENSQLQNDLESDCQELHALEEKDSRNSGAVGGASFYVSFSDIISVLLCFFILFFAMGKVDGAKAAKLASTFTEKVTQKKPVYNAYVSEEEFTMMEKVKELVLDNVKPEDIIGSKTKTVSHVISGSDLFYPGETVLSEEGASLLKSKFKKEKVGNVKELIIEGHTDDKEFFEFPEISKTYKTNTELSAARAIKVVEIIEKTLNLPGKNIGIRAYGSNRPLKPNTTDLNRALNRRVVIQIITEVKDKKIFFEGGASNPTNKQNKINQDLINKKNT